MLHIQREQRWLEKEWNRSFNGSVISFQEQIQTDILTNRFWSGNFWRSASEYWRKQQSRVWIFHRLQIRVNRYAERLSQENRPNKTKWERPKRIRTKNVAWYVHNIRLCRWQTYVPIQPVTWRERRLPCKSNCGWCQNGNHNSAIVRWRLQCIDNKWRGRRWKRIILSKKFWEKVLQWENEQNIL